MPTPTITNLPALTNAMHAYEARTRERPVAAVLSTASRFAASSPPSLLGLSVAFDPGLDESQVLFFSDPSHFARYTNQITSAA